jgi:hypothetical protein
MPNIQIEARRLRSTGGQFRNNPMMGVYDTYSSRGNVHVGQ